MSLDRSAASNLAMRRPFDVWRQNPARKQGVESKEALKLLILG